MRLVLDRCTLIRGDWSLLAHGKFDNGVHLVSGPIGCGKSTLVAYLAGLQYAMSGTVTFDGIITRTISFQFPEYHVTGLTLAEECKSWGQEPEEILDSAGLTGRGNEDPLKLSRGELKRLHLDCILARPSDLLILDEPFSSLDCYERERICRRLSERKDRGITIIFTHEQSILPSVNRIWEIRGGELKDCGTPPGAFQCWEGTPALIRCLIARGRVPKNISTGDLQEAICRT